MSLSLALAEALDPVRFAQARGFDPEPWQARLLRSVASRIAVPCARQVGKTHTTTLKSLHTALNHPDRDVLVISPSQRQSNEFLIRVAGTYRGMSAAALKKDNTTEIQLANGARVISLPGNEGTVRGFADIRLLIIDEAARVGDDIFASVLPMVSSTDGQIMALSTPWGQRGWFWEICEGEGGSGWERHRVTVYDSQQWNPKRIAETKANVGKFVFASDYEANFEDTDDQLFATADIRRAFTDEIQPLFGGF